MKSKSDFPYKVECRISEKGHKRLVDLLESSKAESMSSLLRNIIENRKINVKYRDESLDAMMEAFLSFDIEFQRIIGKLNDLVEESKASGSLPLKLFFGVRIEKELKAVKDSCFGIAEIIKPLAEKWLQK